MIKYLFITFVSFLVAIVLIEISARCLGYRKHVFEAKPVGIISGEYKGWKGRLVSQPWIGNGYNTRMQINIAGKHWVYCWSWQVYYS